MFSGSIPALVTPFAPDGAFDEAAYRALIEWQIDEGSSGLVPCGTTGEAATLTFAEQFEIVRVCVDQAKGRVPVIAGAGSNDTRVAAQNLRAAKEAGADAALMVPPYYNRPSQEGIFRHFEALGRDAPLPIVLYNVPARTVTDIQPETLARIVEAYPAIFVAVKDASGVLQRVSPPPCADRRCVLPIVGERRSVAGFQRGGRGGMHLGQRERRAAVVRGFPGGVRGGGRVRCAGAARPVVRAPRSDVRGCIAGASEIRDDEGAARISGWDTVADDLAERGGAGGGGCGAGEGGIAMIARAAVL